MKTIITMFTAMAIAISAFAEIKELDPKTCTEAEFTAVANEILAIEDVAKASAVAYSSHIYPAGSRFRKAAADFDAKFAEKGIKGPSWGYEIWPRATDICLRTDFKDYPVAASAFRNYGAYWGTKSTLEESIRLMEEGLSSRKYHIYSQIRTYQMLSKNIASRALPYIRKYLRRQGKSFVTKNGVNPCDQYMTELTDALNAPRFKGLNEWLAKMGIAASVDFSKFPSEAEVQNLKNKILDGDVDINPERQVTLYLGLGPHGYNAFVKEYNGEN